MRHPPRGGHSMGGHTAHHQQPTHHHRPHLHPLSLGVGGRTWLPQMAAAGLVVNLVQSRAISVNLGRTWLPHGSSISCNLGQSRQDLAAARLVVSQRPVRLDRDARAYVSHTSRVSNPVCPIPHESRTQCVPYLYSIESSVWVQSRGWGGSKGGRADRAYVLSGQACGC